ncbi:MAG: rRNA maturation RNase YbeY [Candidatus Gracilibacteria bacterium]|nr:rRNA maturation RNase YbeY [Candidatus Gracilibacteria bacterium]
MFKLNFINTPDFEVNTKIMDKIRKTISKNVEITQKGILNIVFVSDEEIQKLNNTYRQKDYVTDVLSFHYFEDFSGIKANDTAGEIILNEGKIKSQAIEYGLGEEREFYKLLIHSMLHILGYDHEEEEDYELMNSVENIIWKEIFEKKTKN